MITQLDNGQFDDLINDPDGASDSSESNLDSGGDDWSTPMEEAAASAVEEDDSSQQSETPDDDVESFENLDSQVNSLENKEDKEEEKDEEDEGKEEAKPEEEAKEVPVKEEEPSIPAGKSLKMFKDGKMYEVPQDASVKVKVDGRNEKVSIQELKDDYSGRQSWDKRFTELDGKAKEVEAREERVGVAQETIKTTMDEVRTSALEAMKTGENPLGAVNKIIDMLGIDSYDFNKSVFEAMTEDLFDLDQMDEYEQKAYWLEKKNDHLLKKHESFEENMRTTQAREERTSHVDQMREAHGISEEDFVSAYEQLSQVGDTTPEKVVQYAHNLPFVSKAEELLTPYEDQLDDGEFEGMMARIANTMKTNKSIDESDIVTYLAEVFEVEGLIETANSKADKMTDAKTHLPKKTKVPSQRDLYAKSSYESFSDF